MWSSKPLLRNAFVALSLLGATALAGCTGLTPVYGERGVGVERLVQLVAPMMPHLAETCWSALGKTGMVVDAGWPVADPALLVDSTVAIPVQVNGKRRGEINVPVGAPKELVEKEALSLEAVARMLDGKPPKKLVIVPDRIINVVI